MTTEVVCASFDDLRILVLSWKFNYNWFLLTNITHTHTLHSCRLQILFVCHHILQSYRLQTLSWVLPHVTYIQTTNFVWVLPHITFIQTTNFISPTYYIHTDYKFCLSSPTCYLHYRLLNNDHWCAFCFISLSCLGHTSHWLYTLIFWLQLTASFIMSLFHSLIFSSWFYLLLFIFFSHVYHIFCIIPHTY